jgi:hypothetical protein
LDAEETAAGYYVVLNVGQIGQKHERLIAARNDAMLAGQKVSPIEVIDGMRRQSASKLWLELHLMDAMDRKVPHQDLCSKHERAAAFGINLTGSE